MTLETPVRIFVGTDRSQMVGVKVLEYSVKRHTDLPIEVTPLIDVKLPEPRDPRQRQRTGFSFARFAIPRLANYRGRALYTDADMLVFKDIRELWSVDFEGAKVVVQEELPGQHAKHRKAFAPGKRVKQCSVMLVDCEAARWDPEEIVRGLDDSYSYEDLMQNLCILREDEVSYRVPFRWNSLEHYDDTTCLIHYTDMPTQPWVSTDNPNGYLWSNEVRRMLADGALTLAELEQEKALGFLRPSFLTELKMVDDSAKLTKEQTRALAAEDKVAHFVKHATLTEARERRKQEIKEYERQVRNGQVSSGPTSPRPRFLDRLRARLAR
ncbi:glycosyltransferase [Bradyrhizobium algeriense]|uniref:glycosyltransferase n=1 Tax=Bradyrhizobium algeriense TaxID=634784 RepID=UPI001931127A|nr:glycosyltransferase [Bradyrhizobium algeriense]